ncbi:MAG: hypothetical protein ABI421_22685 [Polyangiaceae bacterium]
MLAAKSGCSLLGMQLRAAFFVTFSLLSGLAFAACGRSALDGYNLAAADGGKDSGTDATPPDGAPSCNPATCPDGCCDDNGVCQGGGDSLNACGSNGGSCVDCIAEGFDTCDPDTHSCARQITSCDQGSCPNGCCLSTVDGLFCEDGTSTSACGNAANTCDDCGTSGQTCDPNLQQCVASTCDPSTCSGCCTATGECHTGTDQTICGDFGALCTNCTASGGSCQSAEAGTGGECVTTPPTCTATSCAGGCCLGPDTCVMPDSDTSCGIGGEQCENCTGEGKTCQSHACATIPCAQSCATSNGCCASDGTCHGGFLSTACGEAGNACVDCTTASETCDITSRTCDNATSTCPAAYGTCPAGVTQAAPSTSTACSTEDISEAASACTDSPSSGTGGAHGAGCASFFSFESTSNPACGSCLSQFDFTFLENNGLFACVQPFEPTAPIDCTHQTGCAADCTTQSCTACASGDQAACVSNVRTGQCSTFYNRANLCENAAFALGANFCNPARYTNRDFGLWLQAVGAHYCAD